VISLVIAMFASWAGMAAKIAPPANVCTRRGGTCTL
jgi:hypothetical protein